MAVRCAITCSIFLVALLGVLIPLSAQTTGEVNPKPSATTDLDSKQKIEVDIRCFNKAGSNLSDLSVAVRLHDSQAFVFVQPVENVYKIELEPESTLAVLVFHSKNNRFALVDNISGRHSSIVNVSMAGQDNSIALQEIRSWQRILDFIQKDKEKQLKDFFDKLDIEVLDDRWQANRDEIRKEFDNDPYSFHELDVSIRDVRRIMKSWNSDR